jgi:hypothetical protein
MASFQADRQVAESPAAFALRELIACWDQGYEALARGDLERVEALLDIADDHLRSLPDPGGDGPLEAELRTEAVAARGRLEHGMHAGLTGLRTEIDRTRQGARVLQGYRGPAHALGGRIEKSV